jgi:hypothetical protein
VWFVDSDDWIEEGCLSGIMERLEQTGVDALQLQYRNVYADAPDEEVYSTIHGIVEGREWLLSDAFFVAVPFMVYRREFLLRHNLTFYPGIYHEDELFTPCLFLRAKTILSVAQPAYFYRQREGTITSSKSSAVVRKRLDDIFFILKSLREMQEPMLTRKVRQLTVDYLQNVWMLTRNWQVLRERSNQLRDESFLPLPLKTYSLRYFCVAVVLRILGILRVL